MASATFTHIRNYASASVLTALAGIITFPLLTRNLSVEEYGILGLITATLTIFVAVGKLGVQHAVIRYYSQIKNANLPYNLREMNSTVSMVFLSFASITAIIWLLVGFFLIPNVSDFNNISGLFFIASGIVFLKILGSGVMNFLRAQQRSAVVGFTQILSRYCYLAMVLLILITGKISIPYVLGAMVLAEVISFGFALKNYRGDFYFKYAEVSSSLAKSMLSYGFPLMMMESLGLVMRLSDRYLIQGMLGELELGMYSASYSLTGYLEIILLTAMVQAIKPVYLQMWESEGVDKTKAFLSKGLHSYLVVGLPFIVLFSLVSPYLLSFLASPKYAPGTVIIPFIALSFFLDGTTHFLAAGLFIKKNTKTFIVWGGLATILNLVLNVLTIPHFGILGAAVVTVVSYLFFMIGISRHAFKFLSFDLSFRIPVIVTAWSCIVYLLLFKLNFGSDVANLIVKGGIASVLLVGGIVMLDKTSRDWFVSRLRPPVKGEQS